MTFLLGVVVGVLLAWTRRHLARPLDGRDVIPNWQSRARQHALLTRGEDDRG